ncbi:MAG: M28 family peptidase, partial [Bacteroidales bacterium]
MTHRKSSILTALLVMAGILFIILISFHASRPPAVVPAEASAEAFSAARAAMHLPQIASVPNPLGSTANAEVGEYLYEQLQVLGLEPQVQTTRYQYHDRVANLVNVMARIEGTGDGSAILFMGHYDSRISAPGASDNGSAVITMLELIRMLQHHPTTENDMIFLFSDGEEFGLLGAQAFMAEHPWTQGIGLVINFEAMGTNGQSLMFETGTNNLEVVREFARAVPYPVGNSLSVEIYNRMPNYTDFEVFKTLGYQGLNFAYIGNSFDYHTPGDNIENTDLRSVQHHGSYAAALALYFANKPLELEQEQNAVYFNTFGYGFAMYPYTWVPAITVLVLLAGVVIVAMGIYRKRIHPVRMLSGLVSFAILLLILFVSFDAIYQIIASYYPGNSF